MIVVRISVTLYLILPRQGLAEFMVGMHLGFPMAQATRICLQCGRRGFKSLGWGRSHGGGHATTPPFPPGDPQDRGAQATAYGQRVGHNLATEHSTAHAVRWLYY